MWAMCSDVAGGLDCIPKKGPLWRLIIIIIYHVVNRGIHTAFGKNPSVDKMALPRGLGTVDSRRSLEHQLNYQNHDFCSRLVHLLRYQGQRGSQRQHA